MDELNIEQKKALEKVKSGICTALDLLTVPRRELLKLSKQNRTIAASRHGNTRVWFKKDNLTIQIENEKKIHLYEIDLERCSNSAQLLDYLFQIFNKNWCNGETLIKIFFALEEACEEIFNCNLQGIFCPCGASKQVQWKH